MTTIPSSSATSAAQHTAATAGTADGAVSNPKGTLDKDGFLKLFIAQLKHQDPSKPMDANESVAQMASFSMVEGMNNLQATNTNIATSLNTSSAVGLIGRTVSYVDADGNLQTGKVDRVATTPDGQSTLTVAGKPGIDPSIIAEVSA
jgi:flagellar basal-body rod modification protein FlgD